MPSYILSIDQGTTSSRAIIFNTNGDVVIQHQIELALSYPQDGWVEMDPYQIWQATLTCCQKVIKALGDASQHIVSIGVSNQRETTIIWDKKTGEPIYPAIVWQDRRTSDLCAEKTADKALVDQVQFKTGLLIDPYFSATKIAWILDHVDGARLRADSNELLFGTVDTFLLWHLTQGAVHATDATNASRTLLYDIRENQWDNELLNLFDVPASLLPVVLDSAADFGETAPSLFGRPIPIQAILGDQQASAVGQCCFSKGMMKSTYGTGCFVLLNTGEDVVQSQHRLLSTIAYRVKGQTTYGLEGSIFVAGAAVHWLRDALGFFDNAGESATLAATVNTTEGVYLVPAFTGLGAPYWDPEARGALVGLTRGTQIEHIVRAALEAACYQTKDLLTAMRSDYTGDMTALRVDGGMAANNWLLQFLSDILAIDVERPVCIENSALGAAMMAAFQSGCYASLDEVSQHWRLDRQFNPVMPQEEQERLYLGWQKAVGRILSKA